LDFFYNKLIYNDFQKRVFYKKRLFYEKNNYEKNKFKKIIMIALLVFLFFGCVQTQGDFMGVNKNETNNLKETSDLNETNNLNDINKGAVYNNLL
jgi:hypothetical protein